MKRLTVVLIALLTTSCSLFRNDFIAPDIALVGLRLGPSEGMYQTVLVDLMLTNPNASDLKFNALSYRVRLEGRDLINGTSREPLEVPAGGSAKYTVPATISLMSGFGFIRDLLNKPRDRVAYELNATLEPSGLFSVPLTVRKADAIRLAQ
jgi:LEA14-like dessication related protein